MSTASMVHPVRRAIDFRRKDVRWAFPPAIPLEWTKKKIDDEMRQNGTKLDLVGYDLLKNIGFEMVVSPKIARGKFTVDEKASQPNGELVGGIIDYIAESIASAAGNMASESGQISGVELNLSHLRPAFIGQEVTATATPLRQGRAVQVWEVKIETEYLKESTTESNADPRETALMSIGRFTLVNQKNRGVVKDPALQSKL